MTSRILTPTAQGRFLFGVVPTGAAEDAAGATVDEDGLDHEAVRLKKLQEQMKESLALFCSVSFSFCLSLGVSLSQTNRYTYHPFLNVMKCGMQNS